MYRYLGTRVPKFRYMYKMYYCRRVAAAACIHGHARIDAREDITVPANLVRPYRYLYRYLYSRTVR